MKIIDCFTFYNELKLLEYRLNILYNIVDYFIIVEANQTHQGKSKKLYYNENKNRFEKFQDKIIHIVVDLPYIYPNINYKNNKNFQVIN
jgi:beta-1,4-mannosyl-glycoprotein beta-1,4-N-acetylglucosaminyltransferase